MICPVTNWIFAQPGEHRPCPHCPHCLLCDHKKDSEKEHAHFRDSQQMKGLKSRMFPNQNPHAYCHVALCVCNGPQ
jgi:hypothetical protein